MLAGLLFAIRDADDVPGALTATLPFAGATLIEHQARLVAAAGAGQVVIVVARLTPELIGAIGRIGRRGIIVDTVRSAAEVAEKLHPLANVMMLADGLTSNDEVVATMAREGGDALLVLGDEATGNYERLGGGLWWAGIARLEARRIAELARLPRDYDVESTLIRLAAQARPLHVLLAPAALGAGHGIEHGGRSLAARGRGVLAGMLMARTGWFHRLVVVPLATSVVPVLVSRTISGVTVALAAGMLAIGGAALIWWDLPIAGLIVALIALAGWSIVGVLADLRDEAALGRATRFAAGATAAFAAIGYGMRRSGEVGVIFAVALIVIAALASRASASLAAAWWWGTAPGYLAILLIGAIIGLPLPAFALAALYASATTMVAIDRLRQP